MPRLIHPAIRGAALASLVLAVAVGCAPKVPPADAEFVAKWTATHYALARAERLSPPVASRASAYAAIALYEGWAAFSDSLRSLAGQLNGLTELPGPVDGERYDPALVAMEAQTAVLRDLYREGFASTGIAISALHDSLLAVRAAQGVSAEIRQRSLDYGARLGAAIVGWAARDGFQSRVLTYAPKKGPGYWVATATEAQYRSQNLSAERDFVGFDNPTAAARPGESADRSITVNRPKRANKSVPGINPLYALEPHWGDLRPFALGSGAECLPPPAHPYSAAKGSPLHEEARQVYEMTRALTEDQKKTVYFWADNPGESGTPSGHWMSVVSSLAGQWNLSAESTVEAYALTAIAVADAFIGCWHTKFTTNILRPVTYIQRHIDPTWQPLLNTPPFPTYTSGHSTQSAAAAEVLTALFGDRPYDDPTHVTLGHPVKRLASFREAAHEAGMSRLYGGIHFSMDNLAGRAQGECIGRSVLSRVRTRTAP